MGEVPASTSDIGIGGRESERHILVRIDVAWRAIHWRIIHRRKRDRHRARPGQRTALACVAVIVNRVGQRVGARKVLVRLIRQANDIDGVIDGTDRAFELQVGGVVVRDGNPHGHSLNRNSAVRRGYIDACCNVTVHICGRHAATKRRAEDQR
jgi:hypothetical protein